MPTEHDEEIREIEAVLNAGATRVSTDGLSTQIDLDHLRRRLHELRKQDKTLRRPTLSALDISGAW